MAYTKVTFENPNTGAMREAPVGFSWKVFLFGFFPPLIRGDWKWFAIILITSLITWGLSNFVFCFIYNKSYIKDLIGAGYKATSVASGDMKAVSANVGVQIPVLAEAKSAT